jgi:putative IMPACT (imprinted ancient) family translation regulator
MKTVCKESSSKLIIHKSHFYGYIFPLKNSSEVKKYLESVRKKHKGCNHVAYAFRIGSVENYSDDGEPCKSSGMPLFNLIKYNKLDDVLICVARIFGGVKLGVSGLRLAYSEAGKAALNQNQFVEKEEFEEIVKEMSVVEFSKFEKELKKKKIKYSCEFDGDKVKINLQIPLEEDS